MHIASAHIPLLAFEPAIQNGIHRQAADAPSPNLLVRTARSYTGELLGSHTVKYFAGVLIGLGLMLSPAAGIGLGLIIAGSALWLISTATSTAALHDKNLNSIYRHISASVFSGGIGFGLGVTSVPLAALSAATQPGAGIMISTLMITFSALLPHRMDTMHERNESRRAVEISARAAATNLQSNLRAILTALFKSNEKVTVHQKNDDDDVAIEFNMEDHQDKLSCVPVEGSDKEWIAVERAPNCYDLFEASSFYNDEDQLRYTHHPYTRLPMDQVRIIRGRPLFNLLQQAQPGPIELSNFSVSPDVDEAA